MIEKAMPKTIKIFERTTVRGVLKSKNIAAFTRKTPAQTTVIRLLIAKNDFFLPVNFRIVSF